MRTIRLIWIIAALVSLVPPVLFAQNTPGPASFSIARSTSDGIQLHFELPEWKLENVERDGESLQKISIADAQYIFIDEEETLPVFTTLVAIPYSGGVTLNLLDTRQQNQDKVKLDFDASLARERSAGRYSHSLYPSDQVLISTPQVIRDFRVVSINIYPFQYDQANKQLVVRESMDFRIDFNDLPSVNEIAPPQNYSSSFERIYRGLIINYDEFMNRETDYTNPRMLVIYGNYSDATYLAKVNEYVAWKRQRGFLVSAVSTATAGTSYTAIKTYIQNQYNVLSTRPDYIVLIGDDSGTIAVPTYNTYMDYYYTWLAGGDNLGDVIIGRISVSSTEQMNNYMAKINSLEKNLDISTASWLNKMVLVGDTSSSGISTIYTNQYIHESASLVNPAYTYTELYGSSPSSTTINAAINPPNGVAFYNYRGYIGMSGWPSSMGSLNNGYRLFHAVFITCNTGSWGGGTATTESIVRYGSEAALGGSVTAIGMATSSTHTPMNNCLNVGIFHGIYPLEMRDMAEAMLYGKLYLNAVYGVSNATQAYNFAGFCNIIGDPTARVYVGIPNTFSINAPSSVPAGNTSLEVTVRDAANNPVEGASVTLLHSSGAHFTTFSDASGSALLRYTYSLAGSLTLTVSKDDFKSAASSITINSAGGAVYDDMILDDDNSGQSSGNENAEANPGETIELYVSLHNTSTSTLLLSAAATCNDPWVTILSSDRIEYNSIAPGSTGLSDNPVIFSIASDCPNGHQIIIDWAVESSAGNWTLPVTVSVRNGILTLQSYTFQGSTGNIVNPGDQYPMTVTMTNSGLLGLTGVNARLRSQDMFFTVPDSLAYLGDVNQGATITNTTDTFTIFARSTCLDGMVIPLELYLFNSTGFSQTIPFTVTLGQTSVTDPLGQDAYGYFIFDQGDTSYDQCPTYQWIGIAPAEGGSGTALALTDPGSASDEGDQVGAVAITTVNLPFAFQYYGVNYTQASISSNGFIAFGQHSDADWRNWRLPDAGGPSPMIAVMWDDLDIVSGTSYVYTYYNSAQHYYVVEWYHMISGYDGSTQQTFQAILYDPVFYPTHTGDGQIKLQYKDFHNIDLGDGDQYPHGNYCTIGIEDHTETVGLEYTYNNSYPTAAAPLSSLKSLFITTRPLIPDYPYVAIEQVLVQDPNSNGYLEPGEASALSIRLGNRGLVDATNVAAVLSSTDPYVTVNNANAYYGTILAQGNAYPVTNFSVSVSPSCPAGHEIPFTLNISSATGNWSYTFTLEVVVPELSFLDMTVIDTVGDHNGILDPGETASVTIHLNNVGMIPSPAGSAILTCSTPGITINTGTDSFPVLAVGAYETLSFSISASSSMTDGTLVYLNFNAVAGSTTASATNTIEVGAPLQILIGNGTSTQSYPLDRYYNYCVNEAIYLASELTTAGTIKAIAFNKASGDDVNPITPVTIYMKHTTAASISAGNYSTTGYTQVYSGSFPNNAASGWMEVNLSPMFVYDGVSNLAVLIVKGNQQWINNYPLWTYTPVTPSRTRQNRDDYTPPTNLLATPNLPNMRLKIFPDFEALQPPQNLAAAASHQSVSLTWSEPASGVPTSYKVYRNATYLATLTGLAYTDLAVTNGISYGYFLTAVYPDGESDPTPIVTATPNAYPPTNLTAVAGASVVNLSWTAANGRSALTLGSSSERTIDGYRVYRDGAPITTLAGTTYQDSGLTNGVTYSYHVTTVYANPAGESEPSNTASATPDQTTFVILGTGTSVSTTSQNAPINISDRSNHGQSVYTAAELNAAGIVGPALITQLGFNVISAPIYNLADFVVRIKHTTASNVAVWQSADNLVTVYSNPSYMPTPGGYEMLGFSTPFQWNGTDNILIDTAFNLVQDWDYSGTLQYTTVTSGYRFAYSDVADQTNVFTGGFQANRRYNVKLAFQPIVTGPDISVNPASIPFGDVVVGGNAIQQFSIQNSGTAELSGSITTPAGYTVAELAGTRAQTVNGARTANPERNTLAFAIAAGMSQNYSLTFAPSAAQAYNGNVVINSNDSGNPVMYINLTGTGYIPPVVSLDETTLSATLDFGQQGTDSFTISNTGGQALSFTLAESPAVNWFNAAPLTGSIPAGGNQLITGTFSAAGLIPGNFQTTLLVDTNDPANPQLEVAIELLVNNSLPTIELPDSFSFNMDGSLVVDFDPYVNDANNQALILDYSGNTNVLVGVNGLVVTFSAAPGWFGTETLTFTVSDGMDEVSDTVPVTVNLTALATPVVGEVVGSASGLTLSWAAVPNASEYMIYRSSDPYGTFAWIATTTQTSYLDTEVTDRAFYRVQAVNNPPAK